VCLKLARCGGITGTIEAARAARAAGSEVYLTSTFDGPAGIAAALQTAAALGITRPCGLATLGLFADCPDPFPVRRGAIAVPSAPGLGLP
jgi:L-alanine-DL-glutamate epimerase-like enolase superfamily enzyme